MLVREGMTASIDKVDIFFFCLPCIANILEHDINGSNQIYQLELSVGW